MLARSGYSNLLSAVIVGAWEPLVSVLGWSAERLDRIATDDWLSRLPSRG